MCIPPPKKCVSPKYIRAENVPSVSWGEGREGVETETLPRGKPNCWCSSPTLQATLRWCRPLVAEVCIASPKWPHNLSFSKGRLTSPLSPLGQPATSTAGPHVKRKCSAPCSKIVKNFRMAKAQHYTRPRALVSALSGCTDRQPGKPAPPHRADGYVRPPCEFHTSSSHQKPTEMLSLECL